MFELRPQIHRCDPQPVPVYVQPNRDNLLFSSLFSKAQGVRLDHDLYPSIATCEYPLTALSDRLFLDVICGLPTSVPAVPLDLAIHPPSASTHLDRHITAAFHLPAFDISSYRVASHHIVDWPHLAPRQKTSPQWLLSMRNRP